MLYLVFLSVLCVFAVRLDLAQGLFPLAPRLLVTLPGATCSFPRFGLYFSETPTHLDSVQWIAMEMITCLQ